MPYPQRCWATLLGAVLLGVSAAAAGAADRDATGEASNPQAAVGEAGDAAAKPDVKALVLARFGRYRATDQTGFERLLWAVMDFIQKRSVQKSGAWHDAHATDQEYVLAVMFGAAEASVEKPHLTCGPRADVMRRILAELGVASRFVKIFSDNYDTVQSHIFLEVFNPFTHAWEAWDPDYYARYVDQDGEAVGVLALIYRDLDTIVPMRKSEPGWNRPGLPALKENFFEAVHFGWLETGSSRRPVVFYNGDRFDPLKPLAGENGNSFREWLRSTYEASMLIDLRDVVGGEAASSRSPSN